MFKQFAEMRDRIFEYLKSLVPNWPDYIVQDMVYKGFKNRPQQAQNWLQNYARFNGFASTQQMNWLLQQVPIKFEMFDENTKELLKERMGGGTLQGATNDQERHQVQAKLVQTAPSTEPIILVQHPQGYRLEEGWHRTVQSLLKWPQGYTQQAWVLKANRAYDWNNDKWQ